MLRGLNVLEVMMFFSLLIFCFFAPGVSQKSEAWEEGASGGKSVVYYGAGPGTQQNLPGKLFSSLPFCSLLLSLLHLFALPLYLRDQISCVTSGPERTSGQPACAGSSSWNGLLCWRKECRYEIAAIYRNKLCFLWMFLKVSILYSAKDNHIRLPVWEVWEEGLEGTPSLHAWGRRRVRHGPP